jgi:YegS/Rv2252/BmrU family lipid kinase
LIKIIANLSSSKGTQLWNQIKRRIEQIGIEYEAIITKGKKEATLLAKKAQEQGFKNIVIIGGDGTLNEVINGINLKDTTLTIIPTGCGNDFAKMLGIKSIEDGISSIESDYKKLVDVGLANGRYFINNLGIGLDAYVVFMQEKLRLIKSKFRYLISGLKVLFRFLPFWVDIESEFFKFSGQILGISIGNGRYHGGLFTLTPYAQIDDGLLDICIIKNTNRLRRLFNVPKAIKGTHVFLREVQIFKAKSLSIHSENPFYAHLDGELIEHPLNKLDVRVLNKQLRFFIPKIAEYREDSIVKISGIIKNS